MLRPYITGLPLHGRRRLAPDTDRRTGGACGLMFGIPGSVTTTSPPEVIANTCCVLLAVSSATRSGPTIGSRIWIAFCWLKKYVSNARMLVSGDAANTIRFAGWHRTPTAGPGAPAG